MCWRPTRADCLPNQMKIHINYWTVLVLIPFVLSSCAPAGQEIADLTDVPPPSTSMPRTTAISPSQPTKDIQLPDSPYADVLSVSVSGNPGDYQFAVQISSPDTGCDQFADWWEVVSPEGELLYRRILLHSHVSEQPFTRGGGPVAIQADALVFIRAHMNTVGYGGLVLGGSPQTGFEPVEVEPGFGSGLERSPPQPEGCAF